MTITLRNVDFETLQVIESLKGLKKDLEIEKIPNDETLEAMKECEEILENIRKGKRVPYNSYQEAKEALLKD
ncbi:hypothetical protein HPU229336_01515 [Helicobacter pullorum]|uniref:Uncharacterized protein n=2 Tax=Helicobacter pullorum TaxID=35818 RepID=C5EYI4_9HELI|nr:hypothetical protein [Helicobacter pullorum]EEQ63332.1 hypothetical protein HPMG_00789 [Helicobacter pullorum MIT 98-5489]KAB0574978.1 hypothetical protein F7P74_04800 [Helicobacter pullorum NCTC 12824]KPH50599.1 hypothetical protein HPU229336_01515 [Helicobacter pullorum]OCR06536.1 hypothetical protein BA920_01165 [Helicobacter pullorum]OCR14212.1 hypothetical protein BA919_06800 [Helicobacter pullorum]